VQEAEKFMLKIINGNLLDSDCQYIAHQCNCHSLRGAGLASAIFKAFPWADVYSNRSDRGNDAALFGSITVHGDLKRNLRYVINIYGQLKPGKPSRGRESAASRLEAFGKAIDQIAELPELKSMLAPVCRVIRSIFESLPFHIHSNWSLGKLRSVRLQWKPEAVREERHRVVETH
jgi:hypothetical protein